MYYFIVVIVIFLCVSINPSVYDIVSRRLLLNFGLMKNYTENYELALVHYLPYGECYL